MSRFHRLHTTTTGALVAALVWSTPAFAQVSQGSWAQSEAVCLNSISHNDDASYPALTNSWEGLGVAVGHDVSGDGWAGECFEVTLCRPRIMRFRINDVDLRPGHTFELWIDGQLIGVTPPTGPWGYLVCGQGHWGPPSNGDWKIGFGKDGPGVNVKLAHTDGQAHKIRIRFAGFDGHSPDQVHDACMIKPNCQIKWDWVTPKVIAKGRFLVPDSVTVVPARSIQLGLFDQTGPNAYRDLQVRTATDAGGYYTFPCIDNIDDDGTPLDLMVRAFFVSDSTAFPQPFDPPIVKPVSMWRDQNGFIWTFDTETKVDCAGIDTDHWVLDFKSPDPKRFSYGQKAALHIYSTMLKGWDWVYDQTKDNPLDIMTPTTVIWDWETNQKSETFGTTVSIAGQGNRSLARPDEWDDDVLLHEYGHGVAYHYNFLSPTQVNEHFFTEPVKVGEIPNQQAAWDEGWATFFARAVLTAKSTNPSPTRQSIGWDKNSTTRSKQTVNLEDGRYRFENPSPLPPNVQPFTGTYNDRGDTWEIPIAGALWDIMDAANDDQPGAQLCGDNGDNYTDTAANIFKACRNMASASLKNVHTFYHAYAQLPGVDRPALLKLFCEHGIDVRQDSPERIGTDPPPVVSADPMPINALYSGQPNPLRLGTVIEFSLAAPAQTDLEVFDVRGRVVRTLIRAEKRDAGRYSVPWDGRDFTGSSVRPGVYLYRLVTDGFRAEKKLIVIP